MEELIIILKDIFSVFGLAFFCCFIGYTLAKSDYKSQG